MKKQLLKSELLVQRDALLNELKSARRTIADILDNCPYFFPDRCDKSKLSSEQIAWREKVQPASRSARAAIALCEPASA